MRTPLPTIHIPIALIELNTIRINKPPRRTATEAALKAHQSKTVNRESRRAITKAMAQVIQSTGVTVSINIHNRGVVDHPSLESLITYQPTAPESQRVAQTSSATERADGETRILLVACISV